MRDGADFRQRNQTNPVTTQLTLIEPTHTYTPPLVTARANLAKAIEAFKKAEKLLEDQGAVALGVYEAAGEDLFHASTQVEKWERAQLLIEATKPNQ